MEREVWICSGEQAAYVQATGNKKACSATRSSSKRIPPPSRTGNDSKAKTAVVNHAQQVSGMRISDMPFVRMLSSVVMKLSAPRSEPTQKIAILITHKFNRRPDPGRRSFRVR